MAALRDLDQGRRIAQFRFGLLLMTLALILEVLPTFSQELKPEIMSYSAAAPVLEKMEAKDSAAAKPGASSESWLAWARNSDAEVRQRLDTGEEDSLTNLLRFGVTYTKEFRIDDEYLVR